MALLAHRKIETIERMLATEAASIPAAKCEVEFDRFGELPVNFLIRGFGQSGPDNVLIEGRHPHLVADVQPNTVGRDVDLGLGVVHDDTQLWEDAGPHF